MRLIVVAYETVADEPFVGRLPIEVDGRLKDPKKIEEAKKRKQEAQRKDALADPLSGMIDGECGVCLDGKRQSMQPWEAFAEWGDVETMLVLHPTRFLRMTLVAAARADNTIYCPAIVGELRSGFTGGKCTDPVKAIFGSSETPPELIAEKLKLEFADDWPDRLRSAEKKERISAQLELLCALGELFW